MKKLSLKIFLILMALCLSNVDGSTTWWNRPRYDESKWNVDPAPYGSFARYPASGLSAYSSFLGNEPPFSYPGHSGHIRGVSDTVSICVTILNHDTTDFPIGSYQPQTWFIPAIYNIMFNPVKFDPFADTSLIDYSFIGWTNGSTPIPTPQFLKEYRGVKYYLLYYLWNIPLGQSRILMIKSANAPSTLQYLYEYSLPIKVSEPKVLADTLNAFAACSERGLLQVDYPAAIAWCDSMLVYNASCAPAYAQKAWINCYFCFDDSLAEKSALDSAYAILLRFGDPVLGDSSDWTEQTWEWYRDISAWVSLQRTRYINGKRWARGG